MSTNMNDKHGATNVVSADEAIKRLREGNARYLEAKTAQGDVSPQIRRSTFEEGQHPFAIVLACSDSRVIPEAIFSAGIGDLFTIRVAGNVVDNHQLGSVEYAESHLNCKLVVVLGRTAWCRLKDDGLFYSKNSTTPVSVWYSAPMTRKPLLTSSSRSCRLSSMRFTLCATFIRHAVASSASSPMASLISSVMNFTVP